MDDDPVARLPRRVVVAYAAPAFALALFGVPVFVHLPRFYAEVAGAPLGALGAAILATRALDAALDPLIGAWSDRVRTRWGRRRPFLAIASLPLGLAVVGLFAPPVTGAAAVGWFAVTMSLAFAAWTAVQIPHAALGPELARGFHQRTALFAARDGVWMLGTLAAAAAPALVRAGLGGGSDAVREATVFAVLGVVYAALLVGLPWWCVAVVAEVEQPPASGPSRPDLAPVASALVNRPYRILLAAYAMAALGGALPGTLLFFYVEHVLAATGWGDALLGLYFLTGFAALPGWTLLARRVGKKPAFLVATGMSVTAFLGALALGPGDVGWFAVITVASGAGFGATLTLPASMLADTIDYDEVRTGDRREGLFIGIWGITTKAAAALGAGLALPALGWAGYQAGAPAAPAVIVALKLLYCAVPCACYLSALLVVGRYPIDEDAHRAIGEAHRARQRGEPVSDPLTAEKISV